MQQTGNFSLYFHIPFCSRKCDYCHFFVIPNQKRYHAPFLKALKRQWELRLPTLPKKSPLSIYFGGGTPSCLSPKHINEILNWINPLPNVEITLEVNPDLVTIEQLKAYRIAGVNRLSIGVQSFDDTLLKRLSRTHSSTEASQTIHHAFDSGFENISIDLMYDLPNQTIHQWKQTLEQATKLPITHLSLYNLTIEPHTPFYKKRNTLVFPNQDESLQMLEMAIEHLETKGLKRYEISAFGRPSQHNLGYWTNRPFLGYGPSAFSDWDGTRFQTIANFWRYIKQLEDKIDPIDFSEKLEPEARERERVAVGLRVLDGITSHLDLTALVEMGWLEKNRQQYKLTTKGLLFYDTVASEIVA